MNKFSNNFLKSKNFNKNYPKIITNSELDNLLSNKIIDKLKVKKSSLIFNFCNSPLSYVLLLNNSSNKDLFQKTFKLTKEDVKPFRFTSIATAFGNSHKKLNSNLFNNNEINIYDNLLYEKDNNYYNKEEQVQTNNYYDPRPKLMIVTPYQLLKNKKLMYKRMVNFSKIHHSQSKMEEELRKSKLLIESFSKNNKSNNNITNISTINNTLRINSNINITNNENNKDSDNIFNIHTNINSYQHCDKILFNHNFNINNISSISSPKKKETPNKKKYCLKIFKCEDGPRIDGLTIANKLKKKQKNKEIVYTILKERIISKKKDEEEKDKEKNNEVSGLIKFKKKSRNIKIDKRLNEKKLLTEYSKKGSSFSVGNKMAITPKVLRPNCYYNGMHLSKCNEQLKKYTFANFDLD